MQGFYSRRKFLKTAAVGSAAMDNEECYIYRKFLTSLGLVYVEHQARI